MPVITFSFCLRLSKSQHRKFDNILENQRILYNSALQERRDAWSKSQVAIGLNDQTKSLTEIRGFDENYGSIAYNISKWTLKRLDEAMKGFFRRVRNGQKPGFPRFRFGISWISFGFHQLSGLRVINGKIFIKGVTSGIKVRMHRSIPEGSILKSANFTKNNGRWNVGLVYDVPVEFAILKERFLGIDVGVEYLATSSNGVHFENITPSKKSKEFVRKAARKLSRAKAGSKGHLKAKARLAKQHMVIRNTRTNHLHHVANAIVSSGNIICVENLRIKNMTKSAKGTLAEPGSNVRQKAGLNKALQDAAPSRLIQFISYKAEKAGGMMIKVDSKNTSQNCSGCEIKVKKALKDRWHKCPSCGLHLHRDHNAAINIKQRGIAAFKAARGLGEVNVVDCHMRTPGKALLDSLAA